MSDQAKKLPQPKLIGQVVSESKNAQFVPKIKLGFSLSNVTAHNFLHFIDQIQVDYPKFITEKIDFEDINWKRLINNSFDQRLFRHAKKPYCCGLFRKKGKPELVDAVTIGGKPLLQVCIDSETKDKWPLEDLMELLLDTAGCNPNVSNVKWQQF